MGGSWCLYGGYTEIVVSHRFLVNHFCLVRCGKFGLLGTCWLLLKHQRSSKIEDVHVQDLFMTTSSLSRSLYQFRISFSITTLCQELHFFPPSEEVTLDIFSPSLFGCGCTVNIFWYRKCFALPPTVHLKTTDEHVHSQY